MRADDDPFGLAADPSGTVVTVGTFDGVHRGHQDVLRRLVVRARDGGRRAVLVTFDPHPLEVVNPAAAPPLLTVGAEKLELLAETGLDHAVVLPFTPALSRYTAAEFVDAVLIGRYGMRELLIGYDHGFGRARAGDAGALRALAEARGFALEVVGPIGDDATHPFSSTAIRRAIAGGDLARAAAALGRPYSVAGRVVPGAGRGRALGYRTLNLPLPSPRKLLPPHGVYAVRVATPAGPFGGMLHLGPRPTFGDASVLLEAHLFDADVELYGAWVRVDVIGRLRETVRFDSPDALRAQLAADEVQARAVLAAAPSG